MDSNRTLILLTFPIMIWKRRRRQNEIERIFIKLVKILLMPYAVAILFSFLSIKLKVQSFRRRYLNFRKEGKLRKINLKHSILLFQLKRLSDSMLKA